MDAGRLARLGFRTPEQTLREIAGEDAIDVVDLERVLAMAARSSDPDAAIRRIHALGALRLAAQHPAAAEPVLVALGFSEHVFDLCRRTAGLVEELITGDGPQRGELRAWRDARFAHIAVDDLAAAPTRDTFVTAGQKLADLADASLERALGSAEGLAVMAMGKYGGRELNYASDIDVLFIAGPGVDTELVARHLMEAMNGPPTIFRTDANLRPEGSDGPLVRTLDAYRAYYTRWAQVWEFQSLIKCRFAAGDAHLGASFLEMINPFVWPEKLQPGAIAQIRALKARAEAEVAKRGLEKRQVKLGPGGIRDVEFAVQILQLVHGRTHPELRSPTTLDALRVLAAEGFIAEQDAAELAEAYVLLRHVEHRLQLAAGRQTHTLPDKPAALEHLARGLGYRDSASAPALKQFQDQWRRTTTTVRSLHAKLFYRPLLEVYGSAPAVSDDWLAAIGFDRPAAATKAIGRLRAGQSRSAKLMRAILPGLVQWLAQTPDPDAGVVRLADLADRLEALPHLLALLRDNPPVAQRLCRALGTGPVMTAVLQREPALVAALLGSTGRDRESVVHEATSLAQRGGSGALRRFKDQMWLALAAQDLDSDGERFVEFAHELSHLADACLEAALHLAGALPQGFAVVGMGRLGGQELSSQSDLDVMFVFDGGDRLAHEAAAAKVVALLSDTPPIFRIDTEIRPEGKNGALVRSLESYAQYYDRRAQPWEFQAMLRARHVAGDGNVTARLIDSVSSRVYPAEFSVERLAEIRRIKARIERQRVGRREDRNFQLKTGTGGLIDVEFTVQLLQMRHGHDCPAVRTPNTLRGIDALEASAFIEPIDAHWLRDAYVMLNRTRNHLVWLRGVVSDALPQRDDDLERLARSLGYGHGGRSAFLEDYRRTTRRARQVCDRLFFGEAHAR